MQLSSIETRLLVGKSVLFSGASYTATITRSKMRAARRRMSRCALVTGSNLPAYTAIMTQSYAPQACRVVLRVVPADGKIGRLIVQNGVGNAASSRVRLPLDGRTDSAIWRGTSCAVGDPTGTTPRAPIARCGRPSPIGSSVQNA